MAVRVKVSLIILLFSLLAVASLVTADVDPELQQCKHQCRVQRQFDERQRRECEEKCERYHEEKKRRERGGDEPWNPRSPTERSDLSSCLQHCEEYREQRGERGEGNPRREEEWEGQERGSPYLFDDSHFTTKARTKHGRVRVLQKFTNRSELLRGIEDYRLSILEANPQTFVVPNHHDGDSIFFVAKGEGTATLIRRQDKRESFNIRRGDVFTIRAGITAYLINKHRNEKLVLLKLVQSLNIPGQFQSFYGAGGRDPETFLTTFSDEVLGAAFNTDSDRLRRFFSQQDKGFVIKASEEQIRSMTKDAETGGGGGSRGESKGPFNLLRSPTFSNQYGKLYEVDPSEGRELEEIDITVSFANITKGSMTVPFYNSRATKIAVVLSGQADVEIACPHLSSSESGGRRESKDRERETEKERHRMGYQRVSSSVRPYNVYVVPVAHPVITVASGDQNLEVFCFDVNGRDNQKFPLAGRNNVFNQFEDEAKQLAFGSQGREADEVLTAQNEEWFVRGPLQQRRGWAIM
ncbi:hypothetical protein NMG60_11014008 [Bertholletia excelsa]